MKPGEVPLTLQCHHQEKECPWVWHIGVGIMTVAFLLDLGWMRRFGNDASSDVRFSYRFAQYWGRETACFTSDRSPLLCMANAPSERNIRPQQSHDGGQEEMVSSLPAESSEP